MSENMHRKLNKFRVSSPNARVLPQVDYQRSSIQMPAPDVAVIHTHENAKTLGHV